MPIYTEGVLSVFGTFAALSRGETSFPGREGTDPGADRASRTEDPPGLELRSVQGGAGPGRAQGSPLFWEGGSESVLTVNADVVGAGGPRMKTVVGEAWCAGVCERSRRPPPLPPTAGAVSPGASGRLTASPRSRRTASGAVVTGQQRGRGPDAAGGVTSISGSGRRRRAVAEQEKATAVAAPSTPWARRNRPFAPALSLAAPAALGPQAAVGGDGQVWPPDSPGGRSPMSGAR